LIEQRAQRMQRRVGRQVQRMLGLAVLGKSERQQVTIAKSARYRITAAQQGAMRSPAHDHLGRVSDRAPNLDVIVRPDRIVG
jgi:hypothetical protein